MMDGSVAPSEAEDVISVERLSVSYHVEDNWLRALVDVSLGVRQGEIFGLVGESGSGKTTLALQMLGYRPGSANQVMGRVLFDQWDLTALPETALERLRGRRISYVPQNPTTALNPNRQIGDLIVELLLVHDAVTSPQAAHDRAVALMSAVGMPTPDAILARYPHQLSGGQQQRVVIAMALACEPDLIVLDEPTTGLDVTTQGQILRLLSDLRSRLGTAMLYVTHDLGVIETLADRVGVMYAGALVEIGATAEIFNNPRHPYTAGLIASVPRLGTPLDSQQMLRGVLDRAHIGQGCAFVPRCGHAVARCVESRPKLEDLGTGHIVACYERPAVVLKRPLDGPTVSRKAGADQPALLALNSVSISYARRGTLTRMLTRHPPAPTVRDVSLQVARGEVFALVGESGSGKSTIARAVSGLIGVQHGEMRFAGEKLRPIGQRPLALKKRIQFVFQNPDASLNPRRSVGDSLARPLAVFNGLRGTEARRRIAGALEDVQLPPSYAGKFPDELSGGERQRIAIARALLAEPDLILCDEVLSALDVSVQANILELLKRLRRETGIAMLFITHDLAVVEQIADNVGVLYRGELLEWGSVGEVFSPPYHPYTRSLLEAVPGRNGDAPFVQ